MAAQARRWLRSGRNVAVGTRSDWHARQDGQTGRNRLCPNRRQPASKRVWYSAGVRVRTSSYRSDETRPGRYEHGPGGVVKV